MKAWELPEVEWHPLGPELLRGSEAAAVGQRSGDIPGIVMKAQDLPEVEWHPQDPELLRGSEAAVGRSAVQVISL